jgi:hypothetical protein
MIFQKIIKLTLPRCSGHVKEKFAQKFQWPRKGKIYPKHSSGHVKEKFTQNIL